MTLSTGVGVRLSTASFAWLFFLFLGLAVVLLLPSGVAWLAAVINGDMTGFENMGGPDFVMSNHVPLKPKLALANGPGAVDRRWSILPPPLGLPAFLLLAGIVALSRGCRPNRLRAAGLRQ